MERAETLRTSAFARLFARLQAWSAAAPPSAPSIKRLDVETMSEDQLRDLGLMDGRRPRGATRDR